MGSSFVRVGMAVEQELTRQLFENYCFAIIVEHFIAKPSDCRRQKARATERENSHCKKPFREKDPSSLPPFTYRLGKENVARKKTQEDISWLLTDITSQVLPSTPKHQAPLPMKKGKEGIYRPLSPKE